MILGYSPKISASWGFHFYIYTMLCWTPKCIAKWLHVHDITDLSMMLFVGAVISLAWLAIGFNLAAANSPPVTLHEKVNSHSHCAGYRSVCLYYVIPLIFEGQVDYFPLVFFIAWQSCFLFLIKSYKKLNWLELSFCCLIRCLQALGAYQYTYTLLRSNFWYLNWIRLKVPLPRWQILLCPEGSKQE